MNRIPKKAQRAIDKANRESAAREVQRFEGAAEMPIPHELSINTPRAITNMHDIYFDGVKQKLCSYANAKLGTIIRWTRGNGHIADRSSPQEQLYGKVEIKRKVR